MKRVICNNKLYSSSGPLSSVSFFFFVCFLPSDRYLNAKGLSLPWISRNRGDGSRDGLIANPRVHTSLCWDKLTVYLLHFLAASDYCMCVEAKRCKILNRWWPRWPPRCFVEIMQSKIKIDCSSKPACLSQNMLRKYQQTSCSCIKWQRLKLPSLVIFNVVFLCVCVLPPQSSPIVEQFHWLQNVSANQLARPSDTNTMGYAPPEVTTSSNGKNSKVAYYIACRCTNVTLVLTSH